MEYAVIETGGKQYKVNSGMVMAVESLGIESGEILFEKVLLHVKGESVVVGAPYIDGFAVSAKVIGSEKGDKIRVSQFKAKSRHRRAIGHRQSLTSVEITSLSAKPTVKSTVAKSAPVRNASQRDAGGPKKKS